MAHGGFLNFIGERGQERAKSTPMASRRDSEEDRATISVNFHPPLLQGHFTPREVNAKYGITARVTQVDTVQNITSVRMRLKNSIHCLLEGKIQSSMFISN